MKDGIRLSIIVSCYGRNNGWFAEMLDSFLGCGYHFRHSEILICDDASPPGGEGDVAREYARRHPGLIRVFRNDTRSGIVRSYNRLAGEARGDYLLPFDSDDIFILFDLDAGMDYLDHHPEYAASYGKKRLFSAEKGDFNGTHGGDQTLFAMTIVPRVTHIGMLIRVSDFREIGGYRETRLGIDTAMADVFLWVRLALKKEMIYFDHLRAFYRVHPGQHSQRKIDTYRSEYDYLRQWLIDLNPGIHLALRDNAPVEVTPANRNFIQMMLGVLFVRENRPERQLELVDAAIRLMPFDYGARECRLRLLLATNHPAEAQLEAHRMMVIPNVTDYVRFISFEYLRKIVPEDPLYRLAEAELHRRFFHLTPDEEVRMKQATARK